MTSKFMQIKLSNTEVEILKSSIGSTLEFVGGDSLPDFLISDVIVVGTSNLAIKLSGDIFEAQIEGYSENYAKFKVINLSASQEKRLRAAGDVYFQDPGQVIRGISFVTRTTSELKHGKPTWTIESLRSLVFDLGGSFLTVSRLGEHDEALRAVFSGKFSIADLPTVSSYLEEDLETKYHIHDSVCSIFDIDG